MENDNPHIVSRFLKKLCGEKIIDRYFLNVLFLKNQSFNFNSINLTLIILNLIAMNIEGIWFNELGSKVVFEVNGSQLTGTYQTTVGDATGIYKLVGQLNTSIETGQAIGFVVVWKNDHKDSNSVTTWSGQGQVVDDEVIITTTWLLTSGTELDDDWESTLVGKDTFTRGIVDLPLKKSAKPFPKGS